MKQWQIWMRKWMYCPQCSVSWFEEAGEDPTCTCEVIE